MFELPKVTVIRDTIAITLLMMMISDWALGDMLKIVKRQTMASAICISAIWVLGTRLFHSETAYIHECVCFSPVLSSATLIIEATWQTTWPSTKSDAHNNCRL